MSAAAVTWAALRTPDDPLGAGLRVAAVVTLVLVVRQLVARWPWQLPAVVVAVAVAGFLLADHGLLEPSRGPVGYGNASAAAVVLVGALAWTTAARVPIRAVWVVCSGVGLLLLIVPWATGARAAAAGSLVVVAGMVGPTTPRAHRHRVVALVVVVGLMVVSTTLVATTGRGGLAVERVGALLSERRLVLWDEAADMWGRAPVIGVGIGGFVERSPTARTDRDAARAHHEYLQLAAETGIVGLAIAAAAASWAGAILWRVRPDRGATLALMACGGLLAHAAVDYVLHATVVAGLGAVALGVALGPPHAPCHQRHASSQRTTSRC